MTCSATDGGMTTNLKHQSEKLPDIGHNSGLPKICPCYCPPLMDANIKTKKFAIPTKNINNVVYATIRYN